VLERNVRVTKVEKNKIDEHTVKSYVFVTSDSLAANLLIVGLRMQNVHRLALCEGGSL